MRARNGKITATDIAGQRAIWFHGSNGLLIHGNITGWRMDKTALHIMYTIAGIQQFATLPVTDVSSGIELA